NQTYYRVTNLDSRLQNPDQNLTDDIETFTSSLTHLYSHLTKPFFDIALISYTLVKMVQKRKTARWKEVPILLNFVIVITFYLLKKMSPKFGKLVSEESKRKGQLRFAHTRVIANAEEIAFFEGQEVEKHWIIHLYNQLRQQTNLIISKKLWFIMLEQFLMKYFWHTCGMIFIAIPFLSYNGEIETDDPTRDPDGISTRTEAFTVSKNLLTSGADALERIITSYKEIAELAGHTNRVHSMFHVFNDCENESYQRATISDNSNDSTIKHKRKIELSNKADGQIFDTNDDIIVQDVPIITPNGD
ncbi:unnamed protein product, partial [Didymodactylos carnosus]